MKNAVDTLNERTPLCDLETLLATERCYNETVENVVRNHILANPMQRKIELSASTFQVLEMLGRQYAKAKAGYYELLRLRESYLNIERNEAEARKH